MIRRTIAVDVETYDPNLKDKGDGVYRKDGKLLCASWFDGQSAYSAVPNTQQWDVFKGLMADSSIDKVLHNGIYDLTWLVCGCGIEAKGFMHDTMTRMTYIDEYADLDLDSCCKYFKVQGKNKSDTIEHWYEQHLGEIMPMLKAEGFKPKRTDKLWKWAGWLWDNFAEFRNQMMTYNKQDCRATWYLYMAQEPKMLRVMDAYMIDVKLTPLVIEMKKRGVLIDQTYLKQLTEQVQSDIERVDAMLLDVYGITPEVINSPKQLGTRLNAMGIHSPTRTETGAESWNKESMSRIRHLYPVIPLIEEHRNYAGLLGKYLQGDMAHAICDDGRIHCTFSPNKREDGGTITGRFACSHPNLQNIPANSRVVGHMYGQEMRMLFIPEEGCMMGAFDYSQVEYLLLCHFAVGSQAEWFRGQANAGVDFHSLAMAATGITERRVCKNFNYGVIYGMGARTAMMNSYSMFEQITCKKLGKEAVTQDEVWDYVNDAYNTYHKKLPVIRDTMRYVEQQAQMMGYVETIGGRLQHKPKPRYDPATGKINTFLYKMLNKKIQGSAADILKAAMLTAYEAGVFNVCPLHLTVHDENVVSIPYNMTGTEAAKELQHIMDMSFHDKLKVPMKAAAEVGKNWGYWDSDIWNDMCTGKFDRASECWWYKEVA